MDLNKTYTLNTDGGSSGNPGHAAIGGLVKDYNGNVIHRFTKYIGKTTNNIAEYKALVEGLGYCDANNIVNVVCILDSELVVKQLNGVYKVKNEGMRQMYKNVMALVKRLRIVKFTHVVRAKNAEADALVNETLESYRTR